MRIFYISAYCDFDLLPFVPMQICSPVGFWKKRKNVKKSRSNDIYIYTVSQKTGPLCTAYNFRNIEQIFTKFGKNRSLFILNIVPEFI